MAPTPSDRQRSPKRGAIEPHSGGADVGARLGDFDDVADAVRTLSTNDAALAELEEQARSRPQSTWDDYADATWKWLANGEPSTTS